MSSPNVQIQEVNNNNYGSSGSFGTAGFVGHFERGPVNYPTLISNIDELKAIFGRGINNHANDWYQVYNYLNYSSGIWIARACGDNRANANNGVPVIIDNKEEWPIFYDTFTPLGARFFARTPGTWGNSISIGTITKPEYDANVEVGHGYFAQSIFSFLEDEHIGVAVFFDGRLVEKYNKHVNSLEEINAESYYLYIKSETLIVTGLDSVGLASGGNIDYGSVAVVGGANSLGLIATAPSTIIDLGLVSVPAAAGATGPDYSNFISYGATIIQFTNGLSPEPTLGNLTDTHDYFYNRDTIDLDVFIGNERSTNLAIDLAETRQDCIVFVGLPKILPNSSYTVPYRVTAASEIQIINYIATLQRSTYVHFTGNIKVQYDSYSDKNILVNIAGDAAGLKTSAAKHQPWSIGAGSTRGNIKNIVRMFRILSPQQKTDYQLLGINTTDKHELSTQLTFSTTPSSFSKINIRCLFNYIEKSTRHALRYTVFNQSTPRLREITAMNITNLLLGIKANRGIENFEIQVISGENNDVIIEMFIQPKFVTERILLRMTNTGINNFKVIIGQ